MTTLGVLDQSPIRSGGSAADAIHDTLQLARFADDLGYHRYWLAEHHNSGGLASATPEILMTQVAARTRQIRVGSGGVMLSHYSPLKVAETFRMLETLYPGRIDMGIGRAPGSDGRTAQALAHGPGALGVEHFPEQLMDLYGFLANDFPADHPFRGIRAMPEGPGIPEAWLLGSTYHGASYAAQLGWGFSFAQFISPDGGEDAVREYRKNFRPSPMLAEPRANLGVSVTCADTEAEAERLSWSRWCWRIMAGQNQRRGIPTPEEAMAFPYTVNDRAYIDHMRERSIYGDPDQVRTRLLRLGEIYGVDEFIVVTITHDFAARLRSYELLAQAFDLPRPEPAASAARYEAGELA